jgi:hypothetical protein
MAADAAGACPDVVAAGVASLLVSRDVFCGIELQRLPRRRRATGRLDTTPSAAAIAVFAVIFDFIITTRAAAERQGRAAALRRKQQQQQQRRST